MTTAKEEIRSVLEHPIAHKLNFFKTISCLLPMIRIEELSRKAASSAVIRVTHKMDPNQDSTHMKSLILTILSKLRARAMSPKAGTSFKMEINNSSFLKRCSNKIILNCFRIAVQWWLERTTRILNHYLQIKESIRKSQGQTLNPCNFSKVKIWVCIRANKIMRKVSKSSKIGCRSCSSQITGALLERK